VRPGRRRSGRGDQVLRQPARRGQEAAEAG
jgi:hypothetical protein